MRIATAPRWLALWFVASSGCGSPPDDSNPPSGERAADTSIDGIGAPGDGGLSDRSPADSAPLTDVAPALDPFPDLDEETFARMYEIWIVNRSRTDLLVHASAGAGRVILDTVPGRDSVRVDVRVRARSLRLAAEDESGRAVDSTTLDLEPGASNRWEILDPGGAR